MTKRMLLVLCAALALTVGIATATAGGGSDKMSADDLNAACAAGGGHVAVTGMLQIVGGTALLTGECDITLGENAQVKITDATIDATNGDFDICFSPACGNNGKIDIKSSTIKACAFCGLQIYAPGSGGQIKISDSTLTSNPSGGGGTIGGFPAVGTNVISEGHADVTSTAFVGDTNPVIHGASHCKAKDNTPSTAICS